MSVDLEVCVVDAIEVWHFRRVDRAATAMFTSTPVGGLLRDARLPAVLLALAVCVPAASGAHPVGMPTAPIAESPALIASIGGGPR